MDYLKYAIIYFLFLYSFNLCGQATANSDGDWSDTGSWQGGNIGDGGEGVTMNNGIDLTILNGETYIISSMNVGKDGSITIDAGGTLIINGGFLADKTFTINVDGTLEINGDMDVAKTLVLNVTGDMDVDGSINMAKDANLDISGSLGVTGDLISAKDATLTIDGSVNIEGDLNLGTGSVILGSGPVTAGECTGSACGDSQLPVELISFQPSVKDHMIELTWSTLTEQDNDYFNIERSKDGVNFTSIGTIKGFGTTSQRQDYTFTDEEPFMGESFYRLKQTDFDGDFEIFDIKYVQISGIDQLKIFPNSVEKGKEIKVMTGAFEEEKLFFTIYNLDGRIVFQKSDNGGYTNISIETNLESGVYILNVNSGNISRNARLVIK